MQSVICIEEGKEIPSRDVDFKSLDPVLEKNYQIFDLSSGGKKKEVMERNNCHAFCWGKKILQKTWELIGCKKFCTKKPVTKFRGSLLKNFFLMANIQ